MGQGIADCAQQHLDFELCGIWKRGEDLVKLVDAADVVIDFSLPQGSDDVFAAVAASRKPLVCGVSGLADSQLQRMRELSREIPIVFDRNMSLGIAVLERSVREAAASLGTEFEVEVSEVHHVHKKDAPSGTALKLAEAIAQARGEPGTGTARFDVDRRGEVPGDHEVILRSSNEKLVFGHSVTTRQVFIDGAIRAARWVVAQPNGLYSMQDVLFGCLES